MLGLDKIGKDTVNTAADKLAHEVIPAAQDAVEHAGTTLIDHAQEQVALDAAQILGAVQAMADKLVVDLNRTIDRLNGAEVQLTPTGLRLSVPPLAER